MINRTFLNKAKRFAVRKTDAFVGQMFFDTNSIVDKMKLRPYELHLELTNICNARCIFCPYQYQQRPHQTMSDTVFQKAVLDYCAIQGGSVALTPVVGDALIDPKFLERVHYIRSQREIDRIFLTTNCILLDKFGVDNVLDSGIASINVSTSGFNEEDYERVYRSKSYQRVRENVTELVTKNAERGFPVNIAIAIRNDRPLEDILKDPDFAPILKHGPSIDFTWAFTTAGGKIKAEDLPSGFRLRTLKPKSELCGNLLNGCMVLPDGTVQGCSCVASMDAGEDLEIGNILENSLQEIYTGKKMQELRKQFQSGQKMNETCKNCDMYQVGLELYRTREGRKRADLNQRRFNGEIVRRKEKPKGAFAGG